MKSDVPTAIMRYKNLTYHQKAFLLWCWCDRTVEDRYELFSKKQNCYLSSRDYDWYGKLLFVSGKWLYYEVFPSLKRRGIIKIENEDTRNEIIYVDFSVFRSEYGR